MNEIHEHLSNWLVAEAVGDLTRTQIAAFDAHVAACPACRHQRQAQRARLLAGDAAAVAAPAALGPRLSVAVAGALQRHDPDLRRWRCFRKRRLVRLLLVGVLGALLCLRAAGPGWLQPAVAAANQSWLVDGAVNQTLLGSPRYLYLAATRDAAKDPQAVLSAVHLAVSLFVEAFIWTLSLLLVGLLTIDALRHQQRHHGRPLAAP